MTDWILIPCLKALFAGFDRIAPSRDHASDGAVADAAHYAGGTSDHIPDEEADALRGKDADHVNEVHAIDVDDDLRESDLTMERVVQFLLGRCRSGAEKRLRYVIYNRRIWSASSGWVQKTYTGASPHTEHAHFSASYDTNLEASTASWHLEDLTMPSAEEIADAVLDKLLTVTTQTDGSNTTSTVAGQRIWNQGIPDGTDGQKHLAWQVLRNLGVTVKAVAAQVGVSAEQLAEAIAQVDEQVLAGLADAGRTDDEVAAALRAALGDRAAAVGRLLAGA